MILINYTFTNKITPFTTQFMLFSCTFFVHKHIKKDHRKYSFEFIHWSKQNHTSVSTVISCGNSL